MPVAIPQILIVGLGNLPLPLTRHSVGQLIVDALATTYGIHLASERGGFIGRKDVHLGDTLVSMTLFKSKSLMNISGPSIASTYRHSVKSPNQMIVISDSLSHKPLTLSARLGGSANGHNGLKSLASALGGENRFWQFRIGIGRDESDPAEYVLRALPPVERRFWKEDGLEMVIDEIERVVQKNMG